MGGTAAERGLRLHVERIGWLQSGCCGRAAGEIVTAVAQAGQVCCGRGIQNKAT